MFEGKNIHLSPIDGKKLCSFSQKICRQHRLNGYAFCVRHILEDKNAPFKQCQYTRKTGDTCINAVPIKEDREYCSNHLHLLGLLQKPNKTGSDKTKASLKASPSKCKKREILRKPRAKRKQSIDKTKCFDNNPWYADLKKAVHSANSRVKLWELNPLDKDIVQFKETLDKNKEISKNSYHITEEFPSEDFNLNSFQRTTSTSYYRAHHKELKCDDISTQQLKLLCKLKHQYAQLKYLIRQKQISGKLSYTVLSKFVQATRKDAMETANVLNILENTGDLQFPKVYRSKESKTTYFVPCCMIVENERCMKPALPYTRHCFQHIHEDTEQLLFVRQKNSSKKFTGSNELRCLCDPDFMTSISKRLSATDCSGLELKRKQKRHSYKKPVHRKASKNKRNTCAKKKTTNKNKMRIKCMRHYQAIQEQKTSPSKNPQSHDSDNSMESCDEMAESDSMENLIESTCEFPSRFGVAPALSDSSSDSESDSDILTPEEAFHLPPGSLSFPPNGIEDDDALPGLRNSSSCNIVDEEENELMRCESNFILDSTKQSMINRELSSPTLNELSDFDHSLGMFLSSHNSPDLSPAPEPELSISTPTNFMTSSVSSRESFMESNSFSENIMTSNFSSANMASLSSVNLMTSTSSGNMTTPISSPTEALTTSAFSSSSCSTSVSIQPPLSIASTPLPNFFSTISKDIFSTSYQKAVSISVSTATTTSNEQSIVNTKTNQELNRSLNNYVKKSSSASISKHSSNFGPSTLLKISPVNLLSQPLPRQTGRHISKPINGSGNIIPSHSKPPIIYTKFSNLMKDASRPLEFGNSHIQSAPITNTNFNQNNVNTLSQSSGSITPTQKNNDLNVDISNSQVLNSVTYENLALTNDVDNRSGIANGFNGSMWNRELGESLNTLCSDEAEMLSMALDEETPLEKVNPDIFFTAAFSVPTCQANL